MQVCKIVEFSATYCIERSSNFLCNVENFPVHKRPACLHGQQQDTGLLLQVHQL